MTLIGVRPAGETQLKLNPGLTHILDEKDIVYYIGFTREEYSIVRGPANVRHTLWHACATWAILAMATSGINPYEMEEKYGSHEVKMHAEEETTNEKEKAESDEASSIDKEEVKFIVGEDDFPKSGDDGKRFSVGSISVQSTGINDSALTVKGSGNGSGLLTPSRKGGSGTATPMKSGAATPMRSGTARDGNGNGLDDQQKCDMLRGVKLLRFHSQPDTYPASIPVKVNLLRRDSLAPPSVQIVRNSSVPHTTHGQPSLASTVSSASHPHPPPPSLTVPTHQGDTLQHGRASEPSMTSDHTHRLFLVPSGPKSSLCSLKRLSDVPEECLLEKEGGARDGDSITKLTCSLREMEEGRIGENPWNKNLPRQQQQPAVPSASLITKQMSEPGVVTFAQRHAVIKERAPTQQLQRSSLAPPPLDLTMIRSLSDGGIMETLEEAKMGDPDTPTNLRRMGYYSSEQSLLNPSTPSSASRHVAMNFPSPILARRRTNILESLSRKLSQAERIVPPPMPEEVNQDFHGSYIHTYSEPS